MKLLEVQEEGTFPHTVIRHKPECLPFLYGYVVEELEEDQEDDIYRYPFYDDEIRIEIKDCEGCVPPVDPRDPDEIPF